ncbi:MAG: CRTAC1 family protein [Planctomycetota bacterium]|nr:MAG: CRTAC1 family protein [Planctomycetota bacterium]
MLFMRSARRHALFAPVVLSVHCVGLARAQTPTVQFTEVAADAGIDFIHWDDVVPPRTDGAARTVLYTTGGAAVGDYDNDGWPDLYVTRINAPNLLYHNRGDGTFEEVGAAMGVDVVGHGSGCLWLDIDDDGDLDLYVTTFNARGRNYLFRNDGAAGFVDDAEARGLAYVGSSNDPRVYSGAFAGDYDLDGDLDMLLLMWVAQLGTKLMVNDGTGAFVDQTFASNIFPPIEDGGVQTPAIVFGLGGYFADADDDGYPDALVSADFHTSRLCHNLGDGTFDDLTRSTDVGSDENGMGSAVGDIDNDGDLDWFVTSIYDTCTDPECAWGKTGNRLYRNDGDMQFVDATDEFGVRNGDWGWGTSFLDFDNDGDLDLAQTNGVIFPYTIYEDHFNTDPTRLWENDGTGRMTEVSQQRGFVDTRSGKALVVFDYDLDGDEDVFIINSSAQPTLFRNDGGNQNSWLQIMPRGDVTNHYGVGVRVYAQADPNRPEQMREIMSGGFMGNNEYMAHFGFGPGVDRIDTLRLFWPASGVEQVFHNVPANQRLTIYENPCRGDLDGDRTVSFDDLSTLLVHFDQTQISAFEGDIDGNERVDLTDLALMLSNFGATCE